MSAKSFFIVSAGLIAVAAALVGWHEARQARDAEAAFAVLVQKHARTDAEIRRAHERLATAEQERTKLRSTLEELEKSKVALSTASPFKTPLTTTSPDVLELSKKAPIPENATKVQVRWENTAKDQVLWFASRRAQLASTYGPLFQTLNLSPAQVEKFRDNAIKREELSADLAEILSATTATHAASASETKDAMKKLSAQGDAEYQADQRGLLGEEGYRQLQEYERTLAARNIVVGLAGGAVLAGTPLTAQQAEQLTQALANASSDYRSGGATSASKIDWAIADEQARLILSESQWTVFKTVQTPGFGGGRFGSQTNRALDNALKADSAARASASKPPSG